MAAPDEIMFRGARYILVEGKRDKKDKESKNDVFARVRIRGEGISFYVNMLVRARELKLPFAQQVRSIPDSVDLTADQQEAALAAKKAGELWHVYVASSADDPKKRAGWFWGGDKPDTSKVADVQAVLDFIKKYQNKEGGRRNPIIFVEAANKVVKW